MRDKKLKRLSVRDRKLKLQLNVNVRKPKKLSDKDRKLRLQLNASVKKPKRLNVYDRKLRKRQKDCRQLRRWKS